MKLSDESKGSKVDKRRLPSDSSGVPYVHRESAVAVSVFRVINVTDDTASLNFETPGCNEKRSQLAMSGKLSCGRYVKQWISVRNINSRKSSF